jgi:predicted  nucleic acid-binding Zn-ribbon protein
MAKEVHGYIKTLLVIAAVIFAGGGYAMKINGNSTAIIKGSEKIEAVEADVVDLKLQYKDMENLAKSSDTSLKSINNGISTLVQDVQAMKTDMAVTKVKIETLTKD